MQTRYKTIKESQVTFSELMLPSHSNFNNKIHGGYILNLLDQIAFACASKHSEAYCVTASVDKVNFLNPIEIGELVTMRASINYVGRSSMVIGIRVEAENIKTQQKKHCNSSYFTMVAKDEAGQSVEVPGLRLNTENDIRRFVRAVQRRKTKSEHKESFSEQHFSSTPYLELLKEEKVQIAL